MHHNGHMLRHCTFQLPVAFTSHTAMTTGTISYQTGTTQGQDPLHGHRMIITGTGTSLIYTLSRSLSKVLERGARSDRHHARSRSQALCLSLLDAPTATCTSTMRRVGRLYLANRLLMAACTQVTAPASTTRAGPGRAGLACTFHVSRFPADGRQPWWTACFRSGCHRSFARHKCRVSVTRVFSCTSL